MKLQGSLYEVPALSEQDKAQMFALMAAHYDHVKHDKFLNDLTEKDGVWVLYDETKKIQGFSTFMLFEFLFQNKRMYALYSGDTIVARECWGQRELFRGIGGLFKRFLEAQKEPLYWLLLTKGIRTYLLLPLFFETFYPNCLTETPVYEQNIAEHLARLKFGEFYRSDRGIIRLLPGADWLQTELAQIPEHKKPNPHVGFFLERNPGYTQGDELVCIAKISATNLTRIAKRFAKV